MLCDYTCACGLRQIPSTESPWEKLGGAIGEEEAFGGSDQHPHVRPKLGQHLAAGPTGTCTAGGDDGDSLKLALSFRHSFEQSDPFGANRERIGGVLDI